MNSDGMTALSGTGEPAAYDVAVVEPDGPRRTRLVVRLGAAPGPGGVATVEDLRERLTEGRVTIAVFGPSLTGDDGLRAVQTLAGEHPEVGVLLVAEQLTTELLFAVWIAVLVCRVRARPRPPVTP